jgi:colanic acid biosynthesis glycosyl transferase WcaI
MKKILILTELYYPEETSTGYFLTKIAEILAKENRVIAVTGPASKFLKNIELKDRETRNKVEIFRSRGTRFNKNNLSGRIINLITRSINIFWQAFWLAREKDVVLVVTNPPLLPFIALSIKYLKGCQIILLIHDVYPEVLIATGIAKPTSILVRITQTMNRVLYDRVDRIVTLGRDMSKIAIGKLSQQKKDESKIICIPNWADIEIIKPIDKIDNPLRQQLGSIDRFIILYLGNIGRTHGIEDLVAAAQILQENNRNHPEINFVIVGSGAKKQWLEKTVKQDNLRSIQIFPSCDRSELNLYLNLGDVAIISFISGMAGVSVPSRMYNQMAAGKPIIAIADDWSELALVVKEEKIGWVVKPNDIDRLVKTIQIAISNPELCREMGMRAAAVARSKYNLAAIEKSYQKLFQEFVDLPSEREHSDSRAQ